MLGDGGLELLGELAAQTGDSECGVARDLLCDLFVVDVFDRVAKLRLEVAEQGFEFAFELTSACLLFGAAFLLKALALGVQFALGGCKLCALGRGGGELRVEFVEKAADVGLLRCELGARVGDDGRIEAEARGDVDAGGCARDAEAEFVGGSEGRLVEADSGVEHAWYGARRRP